MEAIQDRIKTIEEMEQISRNLKLEQKIVVTTNGSFDILHSAHVNLLSKAKSEGDILIVLVNSDDSIRRNKGEKKDLLLNNKRRLKF
ncbi:adenylyltransferase/cytidyltransferase family protein [Candidatus Woesearchaeota archaeon]|nr:adenylyltransferase/cytidyltransferase family protein [Candidatus Woesearchaeota archaeon]